MDSIKILAAAAALLFLNGCTKTEVVPGQSVQSTQVEQRSSESGNSRTVSAPSQPRIDVKVTQPASAPAVTKTETTTVKQPATTVVTSSPAN